MPPGEGVLIMFVRIMERDTTIVEWQAYLTWNNTFTNTILDTLSIRSDGIVNENYGVADARDVTGVIGAVKMTSAGLHMKGPQPGPDLTCYAIDAVAGCDDPTVKPFLFMGETDTVSNSANGNPITDCRILAYADDSGAMGGTLKKQMVVCVPVGPADKDKLGFAIGLMAGPSDSADLNAFMHLAVRRLVGVDPQILDTRKL